MTFLLSNYKMLLRVFMHPHTTHKHTISLHDTVNRKISGLHLDGLLSKMLFKFLFSIYTRLLKL